MKERNVTIDIMKEYQYYSYGCWPFWMSLIPKEFHLYISYATLFMISGYLITESKLNVIKK